MKASRENYSVKFLISFWLAVSLYFKCNIQYLIITRHRLNSHWYVHSKKINTTTTEGVNKVLSILNKMGLEKQLLAKGIKQGDTVKIGDVEFEYYE